ncbi:MAG: hypothetical protein IE881_08980, partial [Epsilonproteobacteria bacterium]|nr:hypothetical protein [Campylobacterota bacterium]
DGFSALSSEDTNKDGKFDANDTNFSNVRVWRDMDSDGVSDNGELFTLNELSIASINLSSSSLSTTNNTNTITATSTFTKADGTTGAVANLNFTSNNFYSEFTDKIELDETAMSMPHLSGSGMVRDLREASMLSSNLTTTMQTLQNQGYVTKEAFMSQMDNMLSEWANTSDMQTSVELANSILEKELVYFPSTSREDMYLYVYGIGISSGSSGSSNTIQTITFATLEEQSKWERYEYLHNESERIASIIEILERFNGETFVEIKPEENKVVGIGSTVITDGTTISSDYTSSSSNTNSGTQYITIEPPIFTSLSATQINLIEQSYEALKESIYNSIVLETRLNSYMDEIKLTLDENGFGLDMSGVVNMLNNSAIIDLKNALIDWDDLMHFGKEKFNSIDVGAILELHDWMSELVNNPLMLEQLIQYNGLELNAGVLYIGSNNDDTITIMNSLSNTIYGGDGNDTVTTYYFTTSGNTVDGGNGNDTITAGNGNDTIYGGAGNDTIYASDGDDIITGGADDD